jgi:hypothetical protein
MKNAITDRICFLFFVSLSFKFIYVKTKCFLLVKISICDIKSDTNVKKSHNLKTVVKLKKNLFIFFVPNDLTNNLLKYCTRDLNQSVHVI